VHPGLCPCPCRQHRFHIDDVTAPVGFAPLATFSVGGGSSSGTLCRRRPWATGLAAWLGHRPARCRGATRRTRPPWCTRAHGYRVRWGLLQARGKVFFLDKNAFADRELLERLTPVDPELAELQRAADAAKGRREE